MDNRLDSPSEGKSSWLWRRRRRAAPSSANTDTFGRFAEAFARFMGTSQFILYMTVFVVVWVCVNLLLSVYMGGDDNNPFDPYPFILLNLAFSTQASYAAPLILLAQNRQDDRDRVIAEQDRRRAAQNLADTEFLTREISSLRLAVSELASRDFVRSEIRDQLEETLEKFLLAQNQPPETEGGGENPNTASASKNSAGRAENTGTENT